MKETINEVLNRFDGDYIDYEIYRFTSPAMYWNGDIHTDNIEWLEADKVDFNKQYELGYQLMDEEDYNSTVLANCGEHFADMYDEDGKVLVIVLTDTMYD